MKLQLKPQLALAVAPPATFLEHRTASVVTVQAYTVKPPPAPAFKPLEPTTSFRAAATPATAPPATFAAVAEVVPPAPSSTIKGPTIVLATLAPAGTHGISDVDLQRGTLPTRDALARKLGYRDAADQDAQMAAQQAARDAAAAAKAKADADRAAADAQAQTVAAGRRELDDNLTAWELDAFNWRQRLDTMRAAIKRAGEPAALTWLERGFAAARSVATSVLPPPSVRYLHLHDPATGMHGYVEIPSGNLPEVAMQLSLFQPLEDRRALDTAFVRDLLSGADSSPEEQAAFAANRTAYEPRLRALLVDGEAPAAASSSSGILLILALVAKFGGLL